MSDGLLSVEYRGKEIDRAERPLTWLVVVIISGVIAMLGALVAFVSAALVLLLMPFLVLLDGVLWLITREHYIVDITINDE